MNRIGINGFGRIGRAVLSASVRRGWLGGRAEVTVVNDLCEAEHLAWLLKHDSVHGRAEFEVSADATHSRLVVDGREIAVRSCRAGVNWREAGAEGGSGLTSVDLQRSRSLRFLF